MRAKTRAAPLNSHKQEMGGRQERISQSKFHSSLLLLPGIASASVFHMAATSSRRHVINHFTNCFALTLLILLLMPLLPEEETDRGLIETKL